MKRSQLQQRDNALFALLWEHKGKENGIKTKEISELLEKEFGQRYTVNSIRFLVSKIRIERKAPILYDMVHNTYYWAKNENELREYIQTMQERIDSTQQTINLLKTFIKEN